MVWATEVVVIKVQMVLSEREMAELRHKELTVLNQRVKQAHHHLRKVVAATNLFLRKTEQTGNGLMQHQATTVRHARMTALNAPMLHQVNGLTQHQAMTAQPVLMTVHNVRQMHHNGLMQHQIMTAQPVHTTVHNAHQTRHNGRTNAHNALSRNKHMTVHNAAKHHNGHMTVRNGVKHHSAKHQVIHLHREVNQRGVSLEVNLRAANLHEAHQHQAIAVVVAEAEEVEEMNNVVE
jgi:hypothetical protein